MVASLGHVPGYLPKLDTAVPGEEAQPLVNLVNGNDLVARVSTGGPLDPNLGMEPEGPSTW